MTLTKTTCLALGVFLVCSATWAESGPIACGGIADPPCPGGTVCFDIPNDGCNPLCGGADCSGFCGTTPILFCGGIAQIPCPAGLTCVDDWSDNCTPDCGGADCSGICVESEGVTCAGVAGQPCPNGYTCRDTSGDGCHPDCGGADCGGLCVRPATLFCGGIASVPCPDGLICIDDPSDSCINDCNGFDCSGACVEPVVACGRSHAPECDGACPGFQPCVATAGSDSCHCEPLVIPCEGSPAPTCGGACPAGSRCAPSSLVPDAGCSCASCTAVVPGSNIEVVWPSPEFMTWDELPCADWYNSYRLTAKTLEDADGDGMADNYGSCLQADIPFPVAADPTDPPDGFTNFYLITGENDQGEGSLGFNSVPQTRSNQSPCP